MASSSSSASTPSWKYDVFLSFRGEDTRNNFTDHLHEGLKRFGIRTFIDDQLRRGDRISPALLQAIEDSRFSIIIFSQNYASSSWCLDELTKILECVDKGKHTAFPVFYEVDPSHVREQRGSYEEAFRRHEEAYKNNMEKVVKWREALAMASGYSGWDTRDRRQPEVIKEIVDKIFNEVAVNPSSSNKIGMDSRIKNALSLLSIGSHDVRMVGIWGMAGIGKTTLAEAIYDEINTQFEGHCFLPNVRENLERIDKLQMDLLSNILREKNLGERIFNLGANSIKKALNMKKVLIVLDDVDNKKQLEELAGHHDWFGLESRIIITTRDKHLLIQKDVDAIYEAKELLKEEACMLFCQHAFKNKTPIGDFKVLCDHFLDYTKGNPLAIKILGSHLYKRTKKEWDCELKKLKKFPNKEVQEVLRISFDGLEDTVKEIFLDIACFFKEKDKDHVSELLESCDLYPETGIPTLIERALITISYNRLSMHDLIQEMGWEIVRQQSIEDPGKRSRLWLNEDVEDVLTTNRGTETIQGMVLDLFALEESLNFNVDVFTKMIKLRVLEFHDEQRYYFEEEGSSGPCKMHLRGDFKFLSKNLRYLRWDGYPLKSLPSNFNPRKLFQLKMRFSQLEQLWEGNKSFCNLRYMDLSHSQDLIRTPNLSEAPELKELNLEGCTSLVEVHPSIETLKQLRILNLKNCSKLEELAKSFHKLTSLEKWDFYGCSELRKLPDDLRMSSPYLILSGCSKLEELPKSIGELTNLRSLHLISCSELKKLPDDIGRSLRVLKLTGCSKLEELPKSIGKLTDLFSLDLTGCSELKKLPDDIGRSLRDLKLIGCSKLEELPKSIGKLTNLCSLYLISCLELKKLPDDIGRSLGDLKLIGCSKLEELPKSIGKLTNLFSLDLTGCSELKKLPDDLGMSLRLLKLEELPKSIGKLTDLFSLDLIGCSELKKLRDDLGRSLILLKLTGCSKLEELPKSIGKLIDLVSLDLTGCSELKKLPDDLGRSLRHLKLTGCSKLEELPKSIGKLTDLYSLDLTGCSELKKLPNEMENLQSLLRIVADGSGIQEIPFSTRLEQLSLVRCNSSNILLQRGWRQTASTSVGWLRYLDLSGNSFIKLPSLTPLTGLRCLGLKGCKSLQSLTKLPLSVVTIWASNCESLETFSHPLNSYEIWESEMFKFDFEFEFDFSNCGRLLENEESLEAILRGIRDVPLTTSGYQISCWSFNALVAGSRIPEWFTHRSQGNSIILHSLPPDFHLKSLRLSFCIVLGGNLSRWHSDHLWFGNALVRIPIFTHLKFSFSCMEDGKASPVVKECGIRLLYLPRKGEIIEYGTVNATSFSPPPTKFEEVPCWETTIGADVGVGYFYYTSGYIKENVDVEDRWLDIKVESYNLKAITEEFSEAGA